MEKSEQLWFGACVYSIALSLSMQASGTPMPGWVPYSGRINTLVANAGCSRDGVHFRCNTCACQMDFISEVYLHAHAAHDIYLPTECPVCHSGPSKPVGSRCVWGKGFNTAEGLRKHLTGNMHGIEREYLSLQTGPQMEEAQRRASMIVQQGKTWRMNSNAQVSIQEFVDRLMESGTEGSPRRGPKAGRFELPEDLPWEEQLEFPPWHVEPVGIQEDEEPDFPPWLIGLPAGIQEDEEPKHPGDGGGISSMDGGNGGFEGWFL